MAENFLDDLEIEPTIPLGPPGFLKTIATLFGAPAVCFLLAIVGILAADYIARHAYNSPVPGTGEIVEFLAFGAMIFALPAACALADLTGPLAPLTAPKPVFAFIRSMWSVIQLVLLLIVAFAAFLQGLRLFDSAETSEFLGWPVAIKAMAIALGAFLAVCTTFLAIVGASNTRVRRPI